MKIKDVEQGLGIPKATIRFYEKEGLLTPQRSENSYRDYSEEDVERLKQIVVLRKIGVPVEDIKRVLEKDLPLQDALAKNIKALQEQMEEIKGAIKVCTIMQTQKETMDSFDEEYYWSVIHSEEAQGNKFLDLVNDVIGFEKTVVFEEFGLLDENKKRRFSLGKSVLIAAGTCLAIGLLWFCLSGFKVMNFVEGFFFPFVCIVISSVLGLPVFLIERKHPSAAKAIRTAGKVIGVLLLVAVILLMIFLDV